VVIEAVVDPGLGETMIGAVEAGVEAEDAAAVIQNDAATTRTAIRDRPTGDTAVSRCKVIPPRLELGAPIPFRLEERGGHRRVAAPKKLAVSTKSIRG
jgi:hypothetical protein